LNDAAEKPPPSIRTIRNVTKCVFRETKKQIYRAMPACLSAA
jgi:hypothetical protein